MRTKPGPHIRALRDRNLPTAQCHAPRADRADRAAGRACARGLRPASPRPRSTAGVTVKPHILSSLLLNSVPGRGQSRPAMNEGPHSIPHPLPLARPPQRTHPLLIVGQPEPDPVPDPMPRPEPQLPEGEVAALEEHRLHHGTDGRRLKRGVQAERRCDVRHLVLRNVLR